MPSIKTIGDVLRQTRNTELEKGSWVSLSSDLADYPFYSHLVKKTTRRSSFTYAWSLTIGTPNDTAYSQVNDPLQVSVPDISKRLTVDLSKVRKAIGYARDEQELQGTDEEQLVDVVLQRKAEQLDQPLLSFMEHELASDGGTSSDSKTQIYGLKYWLPRSSTATTLALNGGGNPANFSAGAANLTVADVPRWAHAVADFAQVSDSDLFDKVNEFLIRVNYHVPEGAKTIDTASSQRCILCQHPVYLEWVRQQTTANDDLRDDLGMWRGAINFMSIPVKWWPVISEPGGSETPSDHGLLYVLDLNTFKLVTHSAYNFDLETAIDPNVPGTVKLWREGYTQLICVNREKNATFSTTNSDLYVS